MLEDSCVLRVSILLCEKRHSRQHFNGVKGEEALVSLVCAWVVSHARVLDHLPTKLFEFNNTVRTGK